MNLEYEQIENFLSQMEFKDGIPVRFRGYPVKETKVCPKHSVTYAVSYGGDDPCGYDTYEIKLGCPMCAKEEIFYQALGQAAIPKRFVTKSFDNFVASNTSQQTALRISKDYALNLEENLALGRCLIFSGNVGVGKTHLACAIANEAVRLGKTVFFASVSKLIRQVRASWGSKDEQAVIDNLIDLDLLVIDEIGVQAGTENERNIIFDVINGRYEDMKATVILTNLDRTQLPLYLGERIVDRLRENGGTLISIVGNSCRK